LYLRGVEVAVVSDDRIVETFDLIFELVVLRVEPLTHLPFCGDVRLGDVVPQLIERERELRLPTVGHRDHDRQWRRHRIVLDRRRSPGCHRRKRGGAQSYCHRGQ